MSWNDLHVVAKGKLVVGVGQCSVLIFGIPQLQVPNTFCERFFNEKTNRR